MGQIKNENGFHSLGKPNNSSSGLLLLTLRYGFLFSVLFVAIYILHALTSGADLIIFTNSHLKRAIILQTENHYAIQTKGCSIPALNPFDESIIKFVRYPSKVKSCSQNNKTILEQNITHIWINKKALSKYKIKRKTLFCCYQSFFRPNTIVDIKAYKIDDRVKYNDCVYFIDAIEAHDEFVKVTCTIGRKKILTQFFLFAVKKKRIPLPKNNNSNYNVLVLGVDGSSRQNFYRTMPKTLQYMKDKGAVELFGYNKVGDNTFPNLVPMLMGISEHELKRTCLPRVNGTFDNCPFLWEWFKEGEFHTAFGEDSGWLGTFNYRKRGFVDTPTDYYLYSFIREAERNVGKNKDLNAYRCINDHYLYKVVLDYVENLSQIVTDRKLFGFFWEVSMSHDYLNYPMLIDDTYKTFFEKLESTGYLNNTILFLLSDHGMRWGKIRLTKQGRLEERLPFVFILTPESFRKKYAIAYQNLKTNSRRLTTPFDIHATLLDLVNVSSSLSNESITIRASNNYANNRSISLFFEVPDNRSCSVAKIAKHWCTCIRGVRVSVGSGTALEAGGALVAALNALLGGHAECARLRLAAVLEATELVAGGAGQAEWREFLLVARTEPGGAVFEATLRLRAGRWQLAGSASRLNLYASQSRCVHHYHLKLYCYCL